LEEYENNKTLTDNSRRSLVRESVNFLRKNCGNLPKREEKIALAKSIIQLFPSYKVANSKFEGIVSMHVGYVHFFVPYVNNTILGSFLQSGI